MPRTTLTIENRIARLERLNRTLLAVAAGAVLLFIVAAAGGAADPQRARAFQLVDGEGVIRAELAFRDGHPGLFIKDGTGMDRLLAVDEPDGTGLYITDADGTTRIGVAQFAHGGGGVALHGPDSKGAAVLYFKDQGSLRFFDREGNVTRQIIGAPPEPE
jgi:hypothetical protein